MLNFDQILPAVYVGTCPTNDVDVKRLRSLEITAVLNLQTDADFRNLRINSKKLERAYQKQELLLFRQPILDLDRDDLERHIREAGDFLGRILDVGHRVYVHCTAGRERSPATVIAYLVQHQAYDLHKAVDLVTSRRNCSPFVDVLERVYA